MNVVIDASVAVKWVVEEHGTEEALALRSHRLLAPELLIAECANILWKKAKLKELTADEALVAAHLIERADVELYPMRPFLRASAELAIALDHPAYDCIYLTLALANGAKFVTADARLLAKVRNSGRTDIVDAAVDLSDAPTSI